MTKFLLCWHKTGLIEEVEAARANKEWSASIAWRHLDVLKIKDGKACILDANGRWSRVQRKESV